MAPVARAAAPATKAGGGSEWLMIGGGVAIIIVALGIVVALVLNFRQPAVADAGPVDPDRVGLAPANTVPLVNSTAPKKGEKTRLAATEISKQCGPSVAWVKGKVGTGSGFLLNDNIVATNFHVVQNEFIEDMTVEFTKATLPSDKGPFKVVLLYENPHRDIAFLQLQDGGVKQLKPLVVNDKFKFEQGADLVVIGYPGSGTGILDSSLAKCTLSTRKVVKNVDWYEFKGEVWHGNSGGPVFDDFGEIIGAVTLGDGEFNNVNYCIPSDEIIAHWKQMNYRTADEKKLNGSKHRIRALAQRLINVAGYYSAYLDEFVKLMRTAEKDGLDDKQLADARRAIQEGALKNIEKMLPDDVDKIIASVKEDSNVPADVNESFTKLLESYNATKEYFNQIKGVEKPSEEDHKQILRKTKELRDQQQQVLKKLIEGLDQVLE